MAEALQGEGDAQAARIYANALGQEPEFYAFVRSLKAYETSFGEGKTNMMIVKPESDFLRFMKSPTK